MHSSAFIAAEWFHYCLQWQRVELTVSSGVSQLAPYSCIGYLHIAWAANSCRVSVSSRWRKPEKTFTSAAINSRSTDKFQTNIVLVCVCTSINGTCVRSKKSEVEA